MNGQRTVRQNLIKFIMAGIVLLCGLIMAYLSWYSLRYNYTFWSDYHEMFDITHDNAGLHVIVLVGWLAIGLGIQWICNRDQRFAQRLAALLVVISAVLAFSGALWCVFQIPLNPVADQKSVLDALTQIESGNYDSLLPNGYIGMVPYQLGLMQVYRMLLVFCGGNTYLYLKIVNAVCTMLILIFGERIVNELFGTAMARILFCLAMITYFPLYLYTVFIYGEILSVTAALLLIWMTLLYIKSLKMIPMIVAIFSSVIGVLTRGNFWIFIIAISISLIINSILKKQWKPLLFCAFLIVMPALTNYGIRTYYEHVSGIEINQGIPNLCVIAMGMDLEGTQPAGWNNMYNYYTYGTAGCDREVATQMAKERIEMNFSFFQSGDANLGEYLKEKILTQWLEPTAQSLLATHNFEESTEVPSIIEYLYYGEGRTGIESFLNQYQWIMYLGVALFALYSLIKRNFMTLEKLILILVVVGGFTFSVFWEAKSRYIFPYVFCMIIIATGMYAEIGALVIRWKEQRKEDRNGR